MKPYVNKRMTIRAFIVFLSALLLSVFAKDTKEPIHEEDLSHIHVHEQTHRDLSRIDAYSKEWASQYIDLYQSPTVIFPEEMFCEDTKCSVQIIQYYTDGPYYNKEEKLIALPTQGSELLRLFVGGQGIGIPEIIQFVKGHEYGHHILNLIKDGNYVPSMFTEDFADCYAGVVISMISDHDETHMQNIERTMSLFFLLSDVRSLLSTDEIHGNASSRIEHLREGFSSISPDRCLEMYQGKR